MKTASAPLIALLNSSTTIVMADLFTITLSGGSVLRYTSSEQPVTISGTTWSVGPLIKRTGIQWKTGVEVDTLKMTIEDDGSNAVNGVPILQFLHAGGFDSARVRIDRAFGSAYGSWTGSVFLFSGLVSDMQLARMSAEINVKSELVLLDAQVPRNVYQSRCVNVVFDGTCQANQASFTESSSVAVSAAANSTTIICANTGHWATTDWFTQGFVTFTSGANSGIRRTIKSSMGGVITLIQPLPGAQAIGDTFMAVPGCDGSLTTCTSKFANQARYRGFPYIPVAETVA